MDMEEIQYLLGSAIFARAKKYVNRIESYECKTEENGVRHLSAEVEGGVFSSIFVQIKHVETCLICKPCFCY